jgi:hypothetical protein
VPSYGQEVRLTVEANQFINAVVCLQCGAVVVHKNIHDGWHFDLRRTAVQADSADMWTRPIG